MRAERRVSQAVALTGLVVLAALAAWLVPWHPVPGGPVAPVAADSVFSAAQIARAQEYARWARVWSWGSLALSLVVACWFGLSARGLALTRRLRGPWPVRVVLAVVLVSVVGRVLTLPLAVLARRHVLANGLSDQAWTGFALDVLTGEVVGVVATSVALVAVIGCARRWRRAWPAVAGGVAAVLLLAGSFVYPVVVEPLYNSFTPLADGPLRTGILRLAGQEQVHVDEVLVADASRRTTTLNAYVSGFGGTRRVVVYDTLVDDLPQDEALSVVAHELAHARHDDVLTGSVLGAAGAVLGVGLLGWVVGALGRPGRGRGRGARMADPAVVPLVLALVALGQVAASPVQNTISRHLETRADVDAVRATRDPAAFVELQRQLALRSLADPEPPGWSQLWFGSHPTALQRIAYARSLGSLGSSEG